MCYTCLNYWQIFSDNSSELLKRRSFFLNYTYSNHDYDALVNVDDEELNMLTIEVLHIVCTTFLIIVQTVRWLPPGGKFHQDSDICFSELEKQSSCVAATNIVFEKDFANSDGLHREKPNPNNIALEGIILF
jgi:hypothetical protein